MKCISSINPNWLMLFRETNAVYYKGEKKTILWAEGGILVC
jgi:hypothetical protein